MREDDVIGPPDVAAGGGRRKKFSVGGPERLPPGSVSVSTRVEEDGVAAFRIERCGINLAAYGPQPRVAVEAVRRSSDANVYVEIEDAERFSVPTDWIRLEELLGDDRIAFRFMIYSNETFEFLAIADGVRIEGDSRGPRPLGRLLHFRTDPGMRDRVFDVDAGSESGAVVYLNAGIPGLERRMRDDAVLAGSVVQAVVRRVLDEVLVRGEAEGVPAPVRAAWWTFADRAGASPETLSGIVRDGEASHEDVRDWLDAAECAVMRRGGMMRTIREEAPAYGDADGNYGEDG